ncbi:MAG: heparinase II/III family protein [Verrucomicrobia bacterium]|nr:heparinase II/III family protein [Verrucomicrobiota bacterium]
MTIPRLNLPRAPSSLLALAVAFCSCARADNRAPDELARAPLRQLLSAVATNSALAGARAKLIAGARHDAAKPVLRRPQTLEELRKWRVTLKYKTRPPQMSALPDKEWEIFCLSQGDNYAGALLKVELPRLAAAATLTGDAALFERVRAQLAELAAWSPLERRGWSLNNAKPHYKGDDGAWLGTGWLVRVIADTVDLLPPGTISPDLRAALESRLADELALMEKDWATKRPWYVRSEAAHSNQWILPNEALVRACLFLGVDRHRETCEAGIARLLRSMDVQGSDGEFVEGLRYSGLSLESLYSIARATARTSDNRLLAHPFLQKFPTWLVHHFQPGGFLINAFDAPGSSRGNLTRDRNLLATAAFVTGSPHALWGLRTRARFGETLDAILAANMPASRAGAPPLFANYAKAARLNWRSSWDDDTAAGLWLRGGHATDFHDHMDRGHVNFIIGRRALLIEAGTLNYAVPNNATHLRSIAGHNVLQVGDAALEKLTPAVLKQAGQVLTKERRVAPITVERMDESGGAASVDVSGCYESVVKWKRRVEWSQTSVTIEDEVELKQPDIVQFRWHLGVPAEAPSRASAGQITAGDVSVTYLADQAVAARIESMPDATLAPNTITQHACVVLRTDQPVQRLKLKTQVALTGAASE